jgi:dihydroorotase
MKLLLKQVLIADKFSPYNGLTKDILITNGLIEKIGDALQEENAQLIQDDRLAVSTGWVDIFAHFDDPGFEYKETLETGAAAAAAGGYTHVFVLPDTKPVVDNKSIVEYIVQKSKALPVTVLPIGAISKKIEGKELSEMYDMYNSGAVAFSDGLSPVQTPGLLLKALQYVKAIDAVLIQLPLDRSIAKSGLMNEGMTSTRLGLPGIPSIAEELLISRDIELAKYTDSKLHITGVTTAKSLQLIKEAKAKGLGVSCSVSPYHLMYNDEDLAGYDTNLKTEPPLRSREDMMALRNGIEDGTIDCIASHHLPQNADNKICEFEYALPGMISLQTAFSVINQIFPLLHPERLVALFSTNPREIFSLGKTVIQQGNYADLTLFSRHKSYIFKEEKIKSKCKNTALLNQELKGSVIGIINKEKVYLNN